MKRIRVLIVEDDLDWIKAMTVYLNYEEDIHVVGAAVDAEEARGLAKSVPCDVILMDIQLTANQQEGLYLAAELHERLPDARIIMLTSLDDEQIITRAFTAGAINYVEKTRYKELPQAIRNAVHHPGAMEVLLKEYARLKREEQLKELTPAEREVFELIEQGYTQSQIEKKLFKAESTLKNQVNKMLKKLGVRSSKEAVEKVRRKGIIK